jgi:UDP-glucose:(heptosyl)LPS alpha-1,3-glucosyltransferase
MRVLIVARPWSFHGGVESATAGLLAALVEQGHDVHVLSPGAQRPLRGLTVHRLRLPPLSPAMRAVTLALLVPPVVARGRWDIVQAHERVLGAHVYRAGEGCHRAYLQAIGNPAGRRVYHRVVMALERRVFSTTPAIVAIARRGKDEVERCYRVASERISVVYNGVDLARFHPGHRARDGAKAREEAGVPPTAWTALFVGSGFERKGLGTAIEAFARLGDDGSRLVVIGKGDVRRFTAEAQRLGVAGRIAWLGARDDIERWYAAADALVLPARYEPFGNVHLEALACGVPVVTSAQAGGAEAVVEGVSGAVREAADVDGFAQALAWFRSRSRAEVEGPCRAAAEPFTYARQVAALGTVWCGVSSRKA